MSKFLKRKLIREIDMRDTDFGISLGFNELLPNWCNAVYIEVYNGKERLHSRTILPHQLYLEDLIDLSQDGKFDIIITPKFPFRKSFNIFEVKE
jgi:hypothetical protein